MLISPEPVKPFDEPPLQQELLQTVALQETHQAAIPAKAATLVAPELVDRQETPPLVEVEPAALPLVVEVSSVAPSVWPKHVQWRHGWPPRQHQQQRQQQQQQQ